jgi:hypothetical protein
MVPLPGTEHSDVAAMPPGLQLGLVGLLAVRLASSRQGNSALLPVTKSRAASVRCWLVFLA